MKNMVYIQSGGPTSVINTSFYGAIKEAKRHPEEITHIYGSVHGIEGLIDDDLIDVGLEDEEQIELLLQTPGSILGTTRRKLPKDINDPIYAKIIANLQKHEIKYVFVKTEYVFVKCKTFRDYYGIIVSEFLIADFPWKEEPYAI